MAFDIIEITHPKLASLAPKWAPFSGGSVIFDGFGVDPALPGHASALHATLTRIVSRIDPESLKTIGFCQLPPASLHLTVCDLINVGNLKHLPPALAAEFVAPDGAIPPDRIARRLASPITRSGILQADLSGLTWRVADIASLNNRVIVARLEAAPDDASQDALARMLRARSALGALLHARFGLSIGEYVPHVSLGYLANQKLAEQSGPVVDALNTLLSEADIATTSHHYGRPRLYGFEDMARYSPIAFG